MREAPPLVLASGAPVATGCCSCVSANTSLAGWRPKSSKQAVARLHEAVLASCLWRGYPLQLRSNAAGHPFVSRLAPECRGFDETPECPVQLRITAYTQ